MSSTVDSRKIRRLSITYIVVQLFLLALLIFMAVSFQTQYRAKGMPQVFTNSILASLVMQLLIFYPINRFARKEAQNEIASLDTSLSVDQAKSLRQKRLYGDLLKAAVFIFFVTFTLRAPGSLFVQSTILFTFILTTLSYFQCLNFAIKKVLKQAR